eukprot:190298_1
MGWHPETSVFSVEPKFVSSIIQALKEAKYLRNSKQLWFLTLKLTLQKQLQNKPPDTLKQFDVCDTNCDFTRFLSETTIIKQNSLQWSEHKYIRDYDYSKQIDLFEIFSNCCVLNTINSEEKATCCPALPLMHINVLNFLEVIDWFTVSYVCKSWHVASHYLAQQEFLSLSSRMLNKRDEMQHRIQQRKQSIFWGMPNFHSQEKSKMDHQIHFVGTKYDHFTA